MTEPEKTDITWHDHQVSRADREQLNGHRGCVLWFTGLSGCGKSTVANELDHLLHQHRAHTYLLDGDNVRHALNASPALLAEHGEAYAERFGLGFSPEDRTENIRRVGAVTELFASAGLITLAAFVSPYRRDRDAVRKQVESSGGVFVEVFVDTPLEICERRDPKGLYEKARRGELKEFTGIDAPYEAPEQPEIHLLGGEKTPRELATDVMEYLNASGLLSGEQ